MPEEETVSIAFKYHKLRTKFHSHTKQQQKKKKNEEEEKQRKKKRKKRKTKQKDKIVHYKDEQETHGIHDCLTHLI